MPPTPPTSKSSETSDLPEDERYVSESDWFWSDPAIDPTVVHHQCEPCDEQVGQPNKSGVVVVERLCWCGRKLSSYIDSVL